MSQDQNSIPSRNQAPDSGPRTQNSGIQPPNSEFRTPNSGTHLFLASSNPGKLREFAAAAALRGVNLAPLPGFSSVPICVEDGTTFEENARKKAAYYSARSSGLVFADDSGICVDILDGSPGIYSARFAGPHASDEQNNQRLLEEVRVAEIRKSKFETGSSMQTGRFSDFDSRVSHSPVSRAAHYVCVIALAQAGGVVTTVEGRADGLIVDDPRGAGGFGYDPYFYFPQLGKTFAEMEAGEKFAVSHRGEAFRKLLDYLSSLHQGIVFA
jgi:XTP/dITP diphosphohydrolase